MDPRDFKHGLSTDTLSIPDAAAFLDVSPETVRRLLMDEQLGGFRLGRAKVRIFRASVIRYLEQQQATPLYDAKAQQQLRLKRRQEHRKLRRIRPAGAPADRPAAKRASSGRASRKERAS